MPHYKPQEANPLWSSENMTQQSSSAFRPLVVLFVVLLFLALHTGAEAPVCFTPFDPSVRQDSFSFAVYGDIQDNYERGQLSSRSTA
jgi:hypothetical protein